MWPACAPGSRAPRRPHPANKPTQTPSWTPGCLSFGRNRLLPPSLLPSPAPQRRLAFYSGDYLRRILLKFSTPTVFNRQGAWGKEEQVLGGGLPSSRNYSSVLPGYFEMQAYVWELPVSGPGGVVWGCWTAATAGACAEGREELAHAGSYQEHAAISPLH